MNKVCVTDVVDRIDGWDDREGEKRGGGWNTFIDKQIARGNRLGEDEREH